MFDRQEQRIAAALSGAPANLTRVHRWFPEGPAAPDPSLRLVQRTAVELVYALWGRLRLRRPRGISELATGEAVAMAPGTWHRVLDPTAEAIGMSLRAEPDRIRMNCFASGAVVTGFVADDPDHAGLAGLLATTDDRERRTLAAELILRHRDARPAGPDALPEPVAAMLRAGLRSLHLGVRARDLVDASGLAVAQAYRLFRRAMRTTPRAWLEDRRLELVAGLLGAGYRPGDVARQCGFASRVQFSRAWVRRRGYTPREHDRRADDRS